MEKSGAAALPNLFNGGGAFLALWETRRVEVEFGNTLLVGLDCRSKTFLIAA